MLQATEPQNERDAAHLRLLNHYLHSADNARQFFKSGRDDIDLPAVLPGVCVEKAGSEGGAEAAKRWFNVEHAALISCIGMASRDPQHDAYTWQLAWVIKQYLDRRGRWGEIVTTHRAALDAALRLADPLGEAFMPWAGEGDGDPRPCRGGQGSHGAFGGTLRRDQGPRSQW
ncbi:hypothetical protein E4K10_42375 [Streptomyces sp. T1317-0309]|nr:hypothetical protein E4K10_42375 [Streptomyces sp. T1317-0309]